MLISMATMTRRVQLLIDAERYELLERESTRTGRGVSELIRDAVDSRFGYDLAARRAAYERFLDLAPMPVDDWKVMKAEILEMYDGSEA